MTRRRRPAPSDRLCAWCSVASLVDKRRDQAYCGRKCRQAAFRLRRRGVGVDVGPGLPAGATFAYADPPYPGLSRKYYRREASYAGEVDHRVLIRRLKKSYPQGWALSTSARALRMILPLCPRSARVCAWVKPIGVPRSTYGLHNRWEALIVCGGRHRRPGVRDWLRAQPARRGGTLPGRKPIAFSAWLFDCLGMVPGDKLDDLFPGTGGVGRAWRNLSSSTSPTRRPSRSDA